MNEGKRNQQDDPLMLLEEKPRRKAHHFTKDLYPQHAKETPAPRSKKSQVHYDEDPHQQRDMVTGQVTKVIDGETMELRITQEEYDNKYVYQPVEKIKLRGVKAPPINTEEGKQAQEELEEELLDQYIACEIHGRDRLGTLIVTYDLA